MYTIFCDGASRGNPGESGVGISINERKNNAKSAEIESKEVVTISEYIGKYSNNVAEYISVIRAIIEIKEYITSHNYTFENSKITIIMDSKLVVEQLNKNWKIKENHLQYLNDYIQNLVKELNISYVWVPRQENTRADELSNTAIDKKISPHNKVQEILNHLDTLLTTKKDNDTSHHISKQDIKQINTEQNVIKPQHLIVQRVFFSKTTCLKYQLSTRKEVYMHIGSLQNNSWNWKIVKFNDTELCEIMSVLEQKKQRCAFFHNNSHNNSNTKTQIWCSYTEKGVSIKVQDYSKLLSFSEVRVLQELISRSIWEMNKL